MPEKTVREMNALERKHYSLEARVFHATLLVSIILGLVALLIGLGLYTYALVGQYIGESFSLSRSAAAIINQMTDPQNLVEDVMTAYRKGTKTDTAEFTEREDYQTILNVLREFRQSSELNDVFLAVYDRETSAVVYIVDPDDREGHICLPGDWETIDSKEIETFLNWDGTGKLHFIGHRDNYTWLCTSGVPLRDASGEIYGFVLADISLSNVGEGMKAFVLRYSIAMLIVVNLVGIILTQHMKKTLTAPINAIAEAAQTYVQDKRTGSSNTNHFARLNIRTGDEIENLSFIMADMESDLADYEEHLTAITAEKERINTELSLATRIQADMIPNIFPPFPERTEFDVYATMEPAREVGGDFYDFFLIDDDHLCLVIADVSGKGIPAALFMMASKIILSNNALMGKSPAEILESANTAICANNRVEMFVTVWLGIFEISTGTLTAANAGHEYPALMKTEDRFEMFKDKHGFVIGGMDGVKYKQYEIKMEPGSKLFVYTDGIPEATDENGSMFGTDKMLAALNEKTDGSPKEIIEHVRQSVGVFVKDAEQFDDMTMLCLEYRGTK